MQPNLSKLFHILEKEIDCYRRMQAVLSAEAQSIGLTGKDCFERIQPDKEGLLSQLKQLERGRRQIVKHLAASRGWQEKQLTVTQLAARLDPPDNQKLLNRANRLRELIKDVQTSNRNNQQLIGHYLNLVSGSLQLLTNLMESSPVYQKPGTHQPLTGRRPGAGRFICGSV